jgi:hypothetical protein
VTPVVSSVPVSPTVSAPSSGSKTASIATADKVKGAAARYFDLCREYANQPKDESSQEAFFNKVLEFSAFEAESISTPEEKQQYRDTCEELFKKATNHPTLARVEAACSEGATIDTAEKAVQEFSKAVALPNADKKALAQTMLQAEEKISEINDPKARKLRDTMHDAIRDHLSPDIPVEVLAETQVALDALSVKIQSLDFSGCKTIQEWTALQKKEDALVAELSRMKTATVEKLSREHRIQLHPESMTYSVEGVTYKGRPVKAETDLTPMYEKTGKELRDFQAKRDIQQRAFLTAKYQAREMGGGGDCLFRSMAGVMNLNPDQTHAAQRQQIVVHMRNNRARYQPLIESRIRGDQMARDGIARVPGNDNFEKYLNWMSQQGSWGGEAEIQAFSDLSQRPVVMVQEAHQRRGVNTVFPQSQGEGRLPVVLKNLGTTHFQAMLFR